MSDQQSAQRRRAELLRRATLVQKAILLLSLLKNLMSQRSARGQSAKVPQAAVARHASLKLALACLLDQDGLEALLRELEQALAACAEELGPERLAPAVAIHARAARFLEQPEALSIALSSSSRPG